MLGAQLTSANPFAEMADWGHRAMNVAYGMLEPIWKDNINLAIEGYKIDMSRFFSKAPGMYNQPELIQKSFEMNKAGWQVSIRSMAALIFFTCGFTLAFVVPLMPFFRFFFCVLTWMVSLLEAVVAIPLVALAHLNPEGEGLSGASAKGAYFMIFNVFLRPVLMIFGLICGLIIFIMAIVLLNATYAVAVAGTGAVLHGHPTLVRIIYTLMYGAAAYVCANNCFKPIGMFPEYAMRWIGQQAHHEKMGDGGNAVRGVMGQAQTFGGQKALDVAKFTRGSGGGV